MALTLRLSEAEEQQLEAIKQALGASTSSAALKQMIREWTGLKNELREAGDDIDSAERDLHRLRGAISNKIRADRDLSEVLGK